MTWYQAPRELVWQLLHQELPIAWHMGNCRANDPTSSPSHLLGDLCLTSLLRRPLVVQTGRELRAIFLVNYFFVKLVKMEAWRVRLGEAYQVFLDDDKDDEVNMGMVLNRLQDLIDTDLPRRGVAGGSCEEKSANIERARMIMD